MRFIALTWFPGHILEREKNRLLSSLSLYQLRQSTAVMLTFHFCQPSVDKLTRHYVLYSYGPVFRIGEMDIPCSYQKVGKKQRTEILMHFWREILRANFAFSIKFPYLMIP